MKKLTLTLIIATVALLAAIGSDANAQEVKWDKLPNVELSKVDQDVKDRAVRLMKKESCYYECSDSVYDCVTASPPSKTSLRIAGFIVRQVVRGKPDKDISKDLMERARSVHPFKTAKISLDNAACLGDPKAAVKVVAFTDFECPFCRIVSPILRNLVPNYGGKVVYCFKFFPVKGHGPMAIETSKMGLAADKLGKFWEFHDVMYQNFEDHSDSDVEGYVRKIGLDWKAFMDIADAKETRKAVGASKREGLKLGVKSTPSVYINGKRYHAEKSEVEIKDRIEEELELVK